jgi:hypothetical protein
MRHNNAAVKDLTHNESKEKTKDQQANETRESIIETRVQI